MLYIKGEFISNFIVILLTNIYLYEMTAKEECPLDLDDVGHIRKIFKKLDTMRQEQRNCDIIISVEGKEIYANKDILCAASDYFDAMFSHDTVENESGVVEMKEVSYVAVKKCVDFIYTGKLSTSVEKCEDLLYAANLLQLNDTCDKIQAFLECRLNCESFFISKKIGERFSLGALTKHCDDFALKNLISLSKKEKFASLGFQYVSHLLSASDITTDSKLSVGLKWINYAQEEREGNLMKVVSLIDVEKLSRSYCRQLVESEPICLKSSEFMKSIVLALTPPEVCVIESVTRDSATEDSDIVQPNSLLLFNLDGVHRYIPGKNQLHRLTCSPIFNEDGFSTCTAGQHVYVVFFNCTRVHALNTKNMTWHRYNDMVYDHGSDVYCVAHDGRVYVAGDGTLETLSTTENKWIAIDLDEDIMCEGSCLLVHNNRLYIIGGGDIFFGSSRVFSYSFNSLSWAQETPLCYERCHPSATVFNGNIYVAGGVNVLKHVSKFEMYDVETKTWIELTQMLIGRCRFRLVVVSNKLFAVGGAAEKDHVVEVFDPKIGNWSDHPFPCIDKIISTATISL